ncbi:BTAD domain-containing putative transcriptional regulator [Micromonospora sp. NPDC048842]|uniref:AfsR/SARP family transcriptional regulator n=1 Tax=unclassified Micromonospora TaxID=2617518 RepID=UPI0033C5E28F
MAVEFRLPGEVEARVAGRLIDLGHLRQRGVLAVLLIGANQLIRTDQLISRAWGDLRPQSASSSLYSYLSRLRRSLGEAADVSIRRQSGGYLLQVDPWAIDLHRFRELLAVARTTEDAGRALRIFDEALGLWRGTPLGQLDTPWLDDVRTAADRERVTADRDRTDVALRCGQHAALVPQLLRAVAEHPFDERLIGQLMLALCRSGRQADALDHYLALRRRLADSLGVDPMSELQRLHLRMISGDPTLAAPIPETAVARSDVPRQLPAPPAGFVGRADELAALSAASGADGGVATIGGPGGVGKTWLALHWAYDNLKRFPDGQLYVNLRGFEVSAPVSPEVVLRGLLDALHVPAETVPVDLDAQTALYRSLLADKRMLIVLDNARDVTQVIPLLPGGQHCTVLVTSRARLGGLIAAHGARPVDLEVLTEPEARNLLIHLLNRHGAAVEPQSVRDIASRCAGLPLALSIVAARAAMQPDLPLSVVSEELREEATRLDALTVGDLHGDIRAVFAASHHALSAEAARLFVLLSLVPAPEIGLAAAASLVGRSRDRSRLLLTELRDSHLVQVPRQARYRMHDLVRLYARHRVDDDQPAQARSDAMDRLLNFVLHTAGRAARLVEPNRDAAEPDGAAGTDVPMGVDSLADHAEALAWFVTEHQMLLGILAYAAEHGRDLHVWQLARTLETFFDYKGHWNDWIDTQHLALAAARRMGDRHRQAQAHRSLGVAHTQLGRLDVGYEQHHHALQIFVELDDHAKQADTHRGLGWVCHNQGDWPGALGHNERALELYRRLGDRPGQAAALNNVGWLYSMLGDHRQTLRFGAQATALDQEIGDEHAEAGTWDTMGYAHHHLGEYEQAIDCYHRARALIRRFDDHYNEADILRHLAESLTAIGDNDGAREALEDAVVSLDQIGHTAADEVRAELQKLELAGPVRRDRPDSR